jgi:hypothetical protein
MEGEHSNPLRGRVKDKTAEKRRIKGIRSGSAGLMAKKKYFTPAGV